jgi:hypothetical protein
MAANSNRRALYADRPLGMADYRAIVQHMKSQYVLRVRKWRKQMSGCAWRVSYADGRTINWIEAPFPRTPISLAVFLHEVGHHALGFSRRGPRCAEEFAVWRWALAAMRQCGVEPDARVARRVELSMQYAVGKAVRRGIRNLPAPLLRYLPQAA